MQEYDDLKAEINALKLEIEADPDNKPSNT